MAGTSWGANEQTHKKVWLRVKEEIIILVGDCRPISPQVLQSPLINHKSRISAQCANSIAPESVTLCVYNIVTHAITIRECVYITVIYAIKYPCMCVYNNHSCYNYPCMCVYNRVTYAITIRVCVI